MWEKQPCIEKTDHAAAECALSMRRRGRARTSLLLGCDSHRVLRRCPGGVSVAEECRCVVGGTCDRVMGHHRALTSTRVAHAECAAAGRWLRGRGAATAMIKRGSKSQTGG